MICLRLNVFGCIMRFWLWFYIRSARGRRALTSGSAIDHHHSILRSSQLRWTAYSPAARWFLNKQLTKRVYVARNCAGSCPVPTSRMSLSRAIFGCWSLPMTRISQRNSGVDQTVRALDAGSLWVLRTTPCPLLQTSETHILLSADENSLMISSLLRSLWA
jgi:hypothetical protein